MNIVQNVEKILSALFFTFIFCLIPAGSVLAEPSIIHFDSRKKTMSAQIDGASVRDIVDAIRRQNDGIWFKIWVCENNAVLNETVWARFKDLPLQEALERIFSKFNSSLVFDKNKAVVGVFVLERSYKMSGAKKYVPRERLRKKAVWRK